jgi:hypothetical protein
MQMPSKRTETEKLLKALISGEVVEAWGSFGERRMRSHFGNVTDVHIDQNGMRFSLDDESLPMEANSPIMLHVYPGINSKDALVKSPEFIRKKFGDTENVNRLLEAQRLEIPMTIYYWERSRRSTDLTLTGKVTEVHLEFWRSTEEPVLSVTIGGKNVTFTQDQTVLVTFGVSETNQALEVSR